MRSADYSAGGAFAARHARVVGDSADVSGAAEAESREMARHLAAEGVGA